MKESMGELNMAVIVVIIVAMLSLFFFYFIWPNIQNNFAENTRCNEAICLKENVSEDGKSVRCTIKGTDTEITCAWKG